MPSLGQRLAHAWNAFRNKSDPFQGMNPLTVGYSSANRPDRVRLTRGNERSIVTAAYTRIAIDVANINIRHVRTDDKGRLIDIIKSPLNDCLSVSANTDQTARDFIRDVVVSMFDEGCVAVVPVDTDVSPKQTGGFDILSMRTGKITQWYPDDIKVLLFNEQKGIKEEIIVPKKMCAIIENPFYSVMNEPNSTLQRVIRKLNLLDLTDENNSSGKLDIIVQLPYTIRTEQRMIEAERRRKKLEEQLSKSKYGVAYADATEKITQLNRAVENNFKEQVEWFTEFLYGQLGIPMEVFYGTADEKTMLRYYSGTIETILNAICDEMIRKFLTKTARSQGQSIMYFQDHFKLVPADKMADLGDKFIRNEIMTANEVRAKLGLPPADDPKADELRNPNMPQEMDSGDPSEEEPVDPDELNEARQTLLNAGLNEDDLKGLSDNEIVDLAEEYNSQNGNKQPEEAVPKRSSA
jgi:hypothetical protein